jgi:hypothetical protein
MRAEKLRMTPETVADSFDGSALELKAPNFFSIIVN